MASDEIIWQIINQQFCSFKLKYVRLDLEAYMEARNDTNRS